MLQSVLHMEVVLGMSFSDHGTQQSPMLQQLLAHAERYGTVISHTALVSFPDTTYFLFAARQSHKRHRKECCLSACACMCICNIMTPKAQGTAIFLVTSQLISFPI